LKRPHPQVERADLLTLKTYILMGSIYVPVCSKHGTSLLHVKRLIKGIFKPASYKAPLYFAPQPASILISVPVQKEASSEFKKKMALAISPGCANLFLRKWQQTASG